MAEDFQGLAFEKAELLSSRLKEALSTGQGYVRDRFGVDLGLELESYPTWVILSTAAVGLLLLLLLLGRTWAAVCGGLLLGKKRGSPVTQSSGEPDKAAPAQITKPEEQKKRSRRKAPEKKTQSNGQPAAVAQVEVEVTQAVFKPAPQIKTEKVNEVQTPVQVKKNKKKTKTEVKSVKLLSTKDAKETDDGAWETKVSNREKKQQRRKDKGPEDSGSPGGLEAPTTNVEAPVATAPARTKKNRGNHESLHSRTAGKGDSASEAGEDEAKSLFLSSSWREEPSVNGGGWTHIPTKVPGQMGVMEGAKWSSIHTATHYRTPPKHQSWSQETQAWSGNDGQVKTDLNPGSLSMVGRKSTEPMSHSVELQWVNKPEADDEWSAFNGVAALDPSSDWNAPAEHWGNYEEVVMIRTPPQKEQHVPNKVSEDEKDNDDPSDGAAKSKKKRKKKKKTEEEAASDTQMVRREPQEPPVLISKKQNPGIPSSQKKSELIVEPLKPSQKKKVRRET